MALGNRDGKSSRAYPEPNFIEQTIAAAKVEDMNSGKAK